MQIVNTGNRYDIYNDSLRTFEQLPAQTYMVCFNPKTGPYLEKSFPITVNEKVYGVHQKKVDKVLRTFERMERNLGVILSGRKGIGKSLCAKLLAIQAVKDGYPLLLVNSYFPGIADFIDSIEQTVVVLFDEFDKTFCSNKSEDRNSLSDPQTEMLSLFDGMSQGKKMFVITCNDLRNLNDYIVNRPGRFHYHFRFGYPTKEEIYEYLADKISEEYYGEIEKVISFSRKVDLNYDCLRAIAFELSMGVPFEECIEDLNIVNIENEKYNLVLKFSNGKEFRFRNYYMDMFSGDDMEASFECDNYYRCKISFKANDAVYHSLTGKIFIPGNLLQREWYHYDDDEDEIQEELNRRNGWEILHMEIQRCSEKRLHYMV